MMVIKNSSLSLWGDIRDISHTSQAKNAQAWAIPLRDTPLPSGHLPTTD